jgi:murein DD-endopeptidase MepM/ murein hydrolase activator NlpD
MRPLALRIVLLAAATTVLAISGSTGASAQTPPTAPAAHGLGVRVTSPTGGGTAAAVTAPPDTATSGGAFAYPADGSIVRVGSTSASAFAVAGASPSANATAEASSIVLFNGEVTIASVTAKARVQAGANGASGDSAGSQVSGLTISGAGVGAGPGGSYSLGDWGYVSTLAQVASPTANGRTKGYLVSVSAVIVHLNLDHGGLPAGSEILIGYADASAEAVPAPPPPPKPKPKPKKPVKKPLPPDDRARPGGEDGEPEEGQGLDPGRVPPLQALPSGIDIRLTQGGYVFPVYGPASFSDTFGAGRATTGWHHGEDIFAPLGAPLLAVTDGTVFSVGWNDVGGLRLWLRDRFGNEFYYAHLSAFSQLAVNGKQVEAGDVLGFVGNTGDAEHTPYHLHFEIHPVGLLDEGYDGVIKPYPILLAWQRATDVAIAGVAGYAAPIAPGASAPKPGAILLQVSDISRASGLDPSSLRRAIRSAVVGADDSLVGAKTRFAALMRRLSGGR